MSTCVLSSALLALGTSAAAMSAPPPPPPAEQVQALQSFFGALPSRVPPENLKTFAPFVSPDVKVYQTGKLKYDDRDAWFAYLRSFAPNDPDPTGIAPVGYTISRESYYRTSDGGIMVLEFNFPVAPTGKQVIYHPSNPLRMVTYYLDDEGRLTRVEYGPTMRNYNWLLQEKNDAK